MAVGAIIGAVGAVASAGAGIAGSAMKSSGGGGSAKTSNINLTDKNFLHLGDVSQSYSPFLNQQQYVPQLSNFAQLVNSTDNAAWQKEVEQLDPHALDTVRSLGAAANSMSKGMIPQDVQDQITRSTAFQALSGGYGDTGMGRALTARDLGQTSLGLIGQGASLAGENLNLIKALNPSQMDVASLLFSPQQILTRQDQEKQYNTDIQNQTDFANAGRQFAAQQAQQVGKQMNANNLGNMISGLPSAALQGYNAFKNIFSGSGSGSGSSGGGGFDLNTNSGMAQYVTGDPNASFADLQNAGGTSAGVPSDWSTG